MFFSKLELRQDAEATARLARQVCRDGYRLHQSLWDLFKDETGEQKRDFLYRRVEGQDRPCFYVVSARSPADTLGLWSIWTKAYAPQLAAGQRLAFSLCVNPVVTRRNHQDKPVRHDVVMDAKKSQADQADILSLPELIQRAGWSWLEPRAGKYGFRVEQVRIDGYRQHRFRKGKEGSPICFSTLEFNGLLTVVDPDRLTGALYDGIGPAKSFGCGLLLVRRLST